MLHARLHGRQARAVLLAVVLATGAALLTPPATVAADDATASAESLARSGQHAEAARSYERQAKRLFRAWDTRLTLLAAREYLAAGQTADAQRMLGKVGGRATGDDAILLARIQAELALANGNGAAALAALGSIPKPWPAPLETELLLLEAQADFLSGRTLDGIHALEQRGRLLGATDARDVNYRLLLDALQRGGATTAVPPGATDSDRALDRTGTASRGGRGRRHGGSEPRRGLERQAPEPSGHVAAAAGNAGHSCLHRPAGAGAHARTAPVRGTAAAAQRTPAGGRDRPSATDSSQPISTGRTPPRECSCTTRRNSASGPRTSGRWPTERSS